MADKSVAQKLLFKENYTVILINEPENYRATLGEFPQGVTILNETNKPADLIQVFLTTGAEMETRLTNLKASLKPGGLLWLTYSKGTSGVKTDVNRDIIREYVEKNGYKTVAMISVDDTWSAIRLKVV